MHKRLDQALTEMPPERSKLLKSLLDSGTHWHMRPFFALLDGNVDLLFSLPGGTEAFSIPCEDHELDDMMSSLSKFFLA